LIVFAPWENCSVAENEPVAAASASAGMGDVVAVAVAGLLVSLHCLEAARLLLGEVDLVADLVVAEQVQSVRQLQPARPAVAAVRILG